MPKHSKYPEVHDLSPDLLREVARRFLPPKGFDPFPPGIFESLVNPPRFPGAAPPRSDLPIHYQANLGVLYRCAELIANKERHYKESFADARLRVGLYPWGIWRVNKSGRRGRLLDPWEKDIDAKKGVKKEVKKEVKKDRYAEPPTRPTVAEWRKKFGMTLDDADRIILDEAREIQAQRG